MNLVDANVLLYAVNESDPKHEEARTWLDDALNGQEPVGFAWTVLLAFLRLSTKIGLFPAPLSAEGALSRVSEWLEQPPSVVIDPTLRHLGVLSGLLESAGIGGNLVSEAHLAALSLERRATVVSYDSGFARFPGIRWEFPGGRRG